MQGRLDSMSPEKLQKFWMRLKELACKKRPDSINEANPPAMKAFRGDFWTDEDRPDKPASLNLVFAAFKSMAAQMISRAPIPKARSRRNNEAYAKVVNGIKEYTDREFDFRTNARSGLQDCFIRGTGVIRHERCQMHGLARSKYMDVRDFYIDHDAKCLEEANHVIEEFCVSRWEFAKKFGDDLAEKVPADDDKEGDEFDNRGGPRTEEDDVNPYDRIRYYLAWSKHHGDRRVYAFLPNWSEEHILKGEDDKPGVPWPYTFDDEDFPFTLVVYNKIPSSPWGFGFFDVAKQPIMFLNYMLSYTLQSCSAAAKVPILYPAELKDYAMQIATTNKTHPMIPYDESVMGGRSPRDAFTPIQMPPMSEGMLKAADYAMSQLNIVTGFSQQTGGDAASVETAAESVRVGDQAKQRMADDQESVNLFVTKLWYKEHMINAKLTPTRSVVAFGPGRADSDYEEDPVPGSGVDTAYPEEKILTDIPFEESRLMIRGVGDVKTAQQTLDEYTSAMEQYQQILQMDPGIAMQQQQFQQAQQDPNLAQQMQGMQPPIPIPQEPPPEIMVRANRGIPLDAKARLLEPGIEAYLPQEIAMGWIEGMSDFEIKSEVDLIIMKGSMHKLDHIQDYNEMMQLFKILGGFYVEWGYVDKMAALVNALIVSLEKPELDKLFVDTADIMQKFQMMQQQQAEQQQAEQAQQQGNIDKDREANQQGEREKRQADAKKEENRNRESRSKDVFQAVVQSERDVANGQ